MLCRDAPTRWRGTLFTSFSCYGSPLFSRLYTLVLRIHRSFTIGGGNGSSKFLSLAKIDHVASRSVRLHWFYMPHHSISGTNYDGKKVVELLRFFQHKAQYSCCKVSSYGIRIPGSYLANFSCAKSEEPKQSERHFGFGHSSP